MSLSSKVSTAMRLKLTCTAEEEKYSVTVFQWEVFKELEWSELDKHTDVRICLTLS